MKRGFTLIELLVVIAIIALLASIVLVSLSTARSKARDAVRMAEVQEFQKALEFYANDHGGSYPGTRNSPSWGWYDNNCDPYPNYINPLLTGYYQLPSDPGGSCIWYIFQPTVGAGGDLPGGITGNWAYAIEFWPENASTAALSPLKNCDSGPPYCVGVPR